MARRDVLHEAIDLDLDVLERKDSKRRAMLHAAIDVELSNDSTPDGHPTQTPGAAPSTSRAPIDDDKGANTAVEAAAAAREHHRPDFFKHVLREAVQHYKEAALHLRAGDNALKQLDRQVTLEVDNDAKCAVMAKVGSTDPVHRRPVINGEAVPLGLWAYKFWRREKRLPTDLEAEAHRRGARVMVKAS